MSDYLLQLKPLQWGQEIRDYPTINVEGRYLRASCKAAADSDLQLSNNAKLADFTVELSVVAGERPLDAHDKPLARGLGNFRFYEEMPAGDDPPGIDAFLSAFFYLKPDSYAALWDQVREGGYADCTITINVGPVQSKGRGFFWDVSKPLLISSVALYFTRRRIADNKPSTDKAPRRKGFFAWLNPSATAEAEHDVFVAELLNRDVEKRRRNAWLRKIGSVGRISVYACLLGALFIFRPEGLSAVTTKPLAQLAIGDIMGAVAWVVIGLVLLNALFKPNPRPDFQEAWGTFSLVLIAVLSLGALFLYLQA